MNTNDSDREPPDSGLVMWHAGPSIWAPIAWDWYAGQALAGLLASVNCSSFDGACQGASEIADMMLAEKARREKKE